MKAISEKNFILCVILDTIFYIGGFCGLFWKIKRQQINDYIQQTRKFEQISFACKNCLIKKSSKGSSYCLLFFISSLILILEISEQTRQVFLFYGGFLEAVKLHSFSHSNGFIHNSGVNISCKCVFISPSFLYSESSVLLSCSWDVIQWPCVAKPLRASLSAPAFFSFSIIKTK